METIQFRIIKDKNNSMCRIEAKDIRSTYRTIATSGCICSIDVLLSEMERIEKDVAELGHETVFVLN